MSLLCVLWLRASPGALVYWMSWLKKQKEAKKPHPTETLSTSFCIPKATLGKDGWG